MSIFQCWRQFLPFPLINLPLYFELHIIVIDFKFKCTILGHCIFFYFPVMELEASNSSTTSSYNRIAEVKAFDESKAGVKGLLESGTCATKIPRMFHSPKPNLNNNTHETIVQIDSSSKFSVPIIDLKDMNTNPCLHVEVLDKIRSACKEWGFFHVINHGIPVSVLDEMTSAIRRFHEQEAEARKPFYTRDTSKKVRYFSNGTLFRDPAANWRDTIAFFTSPDPPNLEEIPLVCR